MRLKSAFDQIPKPKMILGDMNGYHRVWGSRSYNTRGFIIVSIANQCDLTILNDGSITFSRGQVESAIDV